MILRFSVPHRVDFTSNSVRGCPCKRRPSRRSPREKGGAGWTPVIVAAVALPAAAAPLSPTRAGLAHSSHSAAPWPLHAYPRARLTAARGRGRSQRPGPCGGLDGPRPTRRRHRGRSRAAHHGALRPLLGRLYLRRPRHPQLSHAGNRVHRRQPGALVLRGEPLRLRAAGRGCAHRDDGHGQLPALGALDVPVHRRQPADVTARAPQPSGRRSHSARVTTHLPGPREVRSNPSRREMASTGPRRAGKVSNYLRDTFLPRVQGGLDSTALLLNGALVGTTEVPGRSSSSSPTSSTSASPRAG